MLESFVCWFLVLLVEGFIKVVVVAVLLLTNVIRVEVEVDGLFSPGVVEVIVLFMTMLRESVAVVIIILGPKEKSDGVDTRMQSKTHNSCAAGVSG